MEVAFDVFDSNLEQNVFSKRALLNEIFDPQMLCPSKTGPHCESIPSIITCTSLSLKKTPLMWLSVCDEREIEYC